MKKHILICLLASLCLIGSTTIAKVADSPGADFLHRSTPRVSFGLGDTHRGGETRSDTLPEQNGLVGHSAAKGQEGESFSAQSGSGVAFIYAEIRSYQTMDSVELRFWDHYMSQFISGTGLQRSFPNLAQGSMLDGADGAQVFTYTSPAFENIAYVSLSSALGDQYLDRFIVQPGDSIYMSIDLKRGDMLFSGNAAKQFEIQYRLQQAFRREDFLTSPSFHLSPTQNPAERRSYFEELSPPSSDFHIKEMKFVIEGDGRERWMEEQIKSDPLSDPALLLLDSYRPYLTDRFFDLLRADVLGKQLYKRITLLKNLPLENSGKTAQLYNAYFSDPSVGKVPDSVALLSAHYADFLLEKESLKSRLTGESLFDLMRAQYPPALYDLLMGKFLLGNYRRLPNYERTISTALQDIQTPFIRESLQHIVEANQPGKPIESLVMLDQEGHKVTLNDYQGETVLLAFWFPGCRPSKLMHERHLIKVKEHFRDRTDFELLSVSTDPNYAYWKQYLQDNPSYRFGNVNLFLGGRYSDPFLSYYDISSYPRLMLVDTKGNLIKTIRMPSDAEGLIELISSVLPQDSGLSSLQGDSTNSSTLIH